MHPIRIRPRSSIADAELARTAVVDLPAVPEPSRLRVPQIVVEAVASLRGVVEHEPERVIVLTLVPVPARRR